MSEATTDATNGTQKPAYEGSIGSKFGRIIVARRVGYSFNIISEGPEEKGFRDVNHAMVEVENHAQLALEELISEHGTDIPLEDFPEFVVLREQKSVKVSFVPKVVLT